jgi:hypothetical protein
VNSHLTDKSGATVLQPGHARSMLQAMAAGVPFMDDSRPKIHFFDVDEAWPLIASDEAELGGRETRGMTSREFAVLLLAHMRGN